MLRNNRLLSGLTLAIVVVASWVVWQISDWGSQGAAPSIAEYAVTSGNSLVLLPFESQGGDEDFSEGIAERLQTSLLLLTDLKVIAKTSADRYRGTEKDITSIGRELDVDHVLKGHVTRRSGKVKIELQLISAGDESKVWSKVYAGDEKDIFRMMNAIVGELAATLDKKISPILAHQLNRTPTRNPKSYNLYLQARAMLVSREESKLAGSLRLLDRALTYDPGFADAYAQKATAYSLLSNMGYEDKKSTLDKAEKNALKAIRLDSRNATAYAILANIYRDQYKWDQSNTAYQIALELNPNDALTIYWYSLLLREIGKPAEAMQYSARAVELDPLHPVILGGHIRNCTYAGRSELAAQLIEDGKVVFGDSFIFYMCWASHYLFQEKYGLALTQLEKSHELNPGRTHFEAQIIFCQARMDNTAAAGNYLTTLGNTPEDDLSRSMVYAGMSKVEKCLSYMQRAASQGVIYKDLVLHPAFRLLHDDPRFQKILKDYGLPLPPSVAI
ncbi:hypothetical protein GCM10007390_08740 [Persicitalea jodogahamensis]|uniref:Tetratricopeptide repeat protein n=2 Tax=Persicitalea jodogahamensis TaxID=402147 RepID=A0A8J3G7L7_9BACT|nr:hypothetical protein GCM10007390_08740 [Persicitalea jodogahamensis]